MESFFTKMDKTAIIEKDVRNRPWSIICADIFFEDHVKISLGTIFYPRAGGFNNLCE